MTKEKFYFMFGTKEQAMTFANEHSKDVRVLGFYTSYIVTAECPLQKAGKIARIAGADIQFAK